MSTKKVAKAVTKALKKLDLRGVNLDRDVKIVVKTETKRKKRERTDKR